MSHHFDQASVQRISSLGSLRASKLMFLLNAPLQVVYGAIVVLVGLATYAYYSYHGCDPYKAGLISNRNQLASYFVLHALTDIPGMAGLFMGVLCCGFSQFALIRSLPRPPRVLTHSFTFCYFFLCSSHIEPGINAMAANTVQDILRRPLQKVQEGTITLITKLLVVGYGTLAIALAYLAKTLDGPVTQLAGSVMGALGAPVVVIIFMGASVPWANKHGALTGAAASLAFNLWMSLGRTFHASPVTPLPSISPGNCSRLSSSSENFGDFLQFNSSANSIDLARHDADLETSTPGSHSVENSAQAQEPFFLYVISYEWYTLIGCVVGISIGLAVSFLSSLRYHGNHRLPVIRRNVEYTDAIYMFPCVRRFWGMTDQPANGFYKGSAAAEIKQLIHSNGGVTLIKGSHLEEKL
ncbi:sodium-coupled monocarboxylate transporter 1 [Elysia marginata]|uniref:Sodium-coupled monocarboxylate transporter 1 n=1 Tax=Elysia marginata TaxID=1093978 RepID=A0AAV4H4N9_9GAST|nr:sodium-coupled monocarboxylate transporter 1 [Elysia marginata]